MRDHASKPQGAGNGERSIQSVDRALSIMEVIARRGGEVRLSEVCEELGLNSSTAHHLLKTLLARNYVRTGTGRGKYMLGSQLVLLAEAVNVKAELAVRARPVLDALNRVTEEAVHLAVMRGDEMITLVKREALHALRVDNALIGKSGALHATATGKILLAGLEKEEVRRVLLLHGFRKYTAHTLNELDEVLEELGRVRALGYSEDREEFQQYVVCTGAPVLDVSGAVMASISVSTPINRATDEHMGLVRREVTEAARTLSLCDVPQWGLC